MPALQDWFVAAYSSNYSGKLDMAKDAYDLRTPAKYPMS
jgi:hypothetical protein